MVAQPQCSQQVELGLELESPSAANLPAEFKQIQFGFQYLKRRLPDYTCTSQHIQAIARGSSGSDAKSDLGLMLPLRASD